MMNENWIDREFEKLRRMYNFHIEKFIKTGKQGSWDEEKYRRMICEKEKFLNRYVPFL